MSMNKQKELPTKQRGFNTEEVYNMYQTLGSMSKVANHFKCNPSSIKYHVDRYERQQEDK
ncbi:MAG: hypothetical protein DRP09_11070 [Candidatus Thorarchaeota archaeon]|nr:MAG: hypothetical protein DRP09_11070 [Candidatus Thorarchaeota archaeon]